MMRIGHFDYQIWAQGGIASYIRRISAAQQAMGHAVLYFSKYPSTGTNPAEQPIVVPTDADLYAAAQRHDLDILHAHGPILSPPPSDLAVIRTLHGHTPYCPSGTQYLKRWNRPCDRVYDPVGCLFGHLFDYCGSIRPQKMASNFFRTRQELKVLPNVPVITVSHFLKEHMIQAGYPAESIHVLHLFAPETKNESPPPQVEPPRFLFLGRIVPQKGLDWLLRALQQVQAPVHLDIAGAGYHEAAIRQLSEKLQLGDRVTFHGWVKPQQVESLIRSARALVFPSLWHEPGGTVAFEAMAHSRAVIMSRVGGMPEVVVDGINGLLVQPNDVPSLADAIERLAMDGDLAKTLGETGRQLAIEQYTFPQHLTQLMRLYQSVTQVQLSQPSVDGCSR
jgi:glycosyltransferase involved in cell wall biosynthesis